MELVALNLGLKCEIDKHIDIFEEVMETAEKYIMEAYSYFFLHSQTNTKLTSPNTSRLRPQMISIEHIDMSEP